MKCKVLIAIQNGKHIFCSEELMGEKRYCHRCQVAKQKIIFLDDNELSLALYAEEYPDKWKLICDSLNTRSGK